MELALRLGDTPKLILLSGQSKSQQLKMKEVGFCMGLESSSQHQDHQQKNYSKIDDNDKTKYSSSSDPPKLQLDLLPLSPSHQVPSPPTHCRVPWLSFSLYRVPLTDRFIDFNSRLEFQHWLALISDEFYDDLERVDE
ncbi:hypothetical protein Tco_1333864, partial [Tanacetum coccineum]